MAELGFENNTSKKLYQQKCFLITTNQTFVWSPAVAFMEIEDLWLAQYTFRYRQNKTLALSMATQI